MNDIYINYKDVLPKELLEYKGDLTFGDGVVTLCNPELYLDIVKDGYGINDAIPFAETAFGELLVWEGNKYVKCLSFSEKKVTVLESGFKYFFEDIEDEEFLNDYLNLNLYKKTKKKLGTLESGYCYTCAPIPYIGGELSEEIMSVGKIREYIAVCIALTGGLRIESKD